MISHLDNVQEKPPKHFVERLSKQVTESMREQRFISEPNGSLARCLYFKGIERLLVY